MNVDHHEKSYFHKEKRACALNQWLKIHLWARGVTRIQDFTFYEKMNMFIISTGVSSTLATFGIIINSYMSQLAIQLCICCMYQGSVSPNYLILFRVGWLVCSSQKMFRRAPTVFNKMEVTNSGDAFHQQIPLNLHRRLIFCMLRQLSYWCPRPVGKQAFMKGCLKFPYFIEFMFPANVIFITCSKTCNYNCMCKYTTKHYHYNLLIHIVINRSIH